MTTSSDTIAAIATGPGEAGISIVRISGPDSLRIADRIFRCGGSPPSTRPGGSFIYGRVVRPDDQVLDEGILLIWRAPRSYTREDVVEIQGHGGLLCAGRILRAAVENGARPAEPGEFTKRAFLNGRIDLVQAEAVLDLVRANSDRAASAAVEQIEGHLSSSLATIYDGALSVVSDLEATLDFSEGDLPDSTLEDIGGRLHAVRGEIESLLAGWEEGHVLREGVRTVISGRPNVGKSTIFNALLGKPRAIVTPHAGTTRDTIEESLLLGGLMYLLIDTAGLREADCEIEREGIRRARSQIARADLRIFVLDASKPLQPEEKEEIQALDAKHSIIIANKADLGRTVTNQDVHPHHILYCNALSANDIKIVKEVMIEKYCNTSLDPVHAVVSERHRNILEHALQNIATAKGSLDTKRPELIVLAAMHLRRAMELLGNITGRTYHEELLDSIFTRFCLGK